MRLTNRSAALSFTRRLATAGLLLLAAATPAARLSAQSATVSVDTPSPEQVLAAGDPVLVTGWAVDPAGPGSGIADVVIYLDGEAGAGGRFIGTATSGTMRADVAEAFGRPEWTGSGYELLWTVPDLAPGPHTLYVYARSATTGEAILGTRGLWVAAAQVPRAPAAPSASTSGQRSPPGEPFLPPPIPLSPFGAPLPYGPPVSMAPIVAATVDSDGTVALTWLPLEGATMYRIYRSSTGGAASFVLAQTISQVSNVPTTYATVAGLSPGTTQFFQVRAVDPTGFENLVLVSAGGAPGFVATRSGVASFTGTVTLTWQPTPRATAYRIYQSATGAANSFTLAETISQSLGVLAATANIAGLTPRETFYFQVRAVEANGREVLVPSTVVTQPDIVLPPTSIGASAAGSSGAAVNWTAGGPAINFRVYQSTSGAAGSFTPAVVSLPTSTGARVTGLAGGTTYYFYVTAVAASGQESSPSATVSVTTPMPTPRPTATRTP